MKMIVPKDQQQKKKAALSAAYAELAYQNEEKEKRAAELVIANTELRSQNEEKEKRAAELVISNTALLDQSKEKEKQTAALILANKQLEQFTFIASHDLQEPLRTIRNYMKVFEEDYLPQLDKNAADYIMAVTHAATRMSKLISGLLEFSRLGHTITLSRVDIKELIETVITDLHGILSQSNAVIEIGDMPVLNVYEPELRQLFQNLISNAVKFQKTGIRPKISIKAVKKAAAWQFTVKDNGIGIEPIYFERIFNIFQRLHPASEYEGTGLGLAICKNIAAIHQGKIWLESRLGKGSKFKFTIGNLII